MAKDFSSDQGGIQSSPSTQFAPHESGTPVSCCTDNVPPSERPVGGPGPGVGANSKKIR